AQIVERVSDKDFGIYLWQNIFEPLGMNDSGVGDFDMVGNRANAYKGRGKKKKVIPNFRKEWIYGMGGIYSTSLDLNKWLHSFSDTLVLSEKSKQKMFNPEKNNYGYGWHVYDVNGHTQYSHGGYLPGWNSYVFFYPADTLSVIVLSNVEHANPLEICSSISRIFYMNQLDDVYGKEEDRFAGRYEILDKAEDADDAPIVAEIVTVNEADGDLKVKTAEGETLLFQRLDVDEWEDPNEEMTLQFKETGGSILLQLSKNGKQWRWRKLSGDYQPTGTTR
ncbi:MAG: serine hydrolase domain-containing protein, partial [Bacteroidota bacterium]